MGDWGDEWDAYYDKTDRQTLSMPDYSKTSPSGNGHGGGGGGGGGGCLLALATFGTVAYSLFRRMK